MWIELYNLHKPLSLVCASQFWLQRWCLLQWSLLNVDYGTDEAAVVLVWSLTESSLCCEAWELCVMLDFHPSHFHHIKAVVKSGLRTWLDLLAGGLTWALSPSSRTLLEKVCRDHKPALNPLVTSRWSQTVVSVFCKWDASRFQQSSAKGPTGHGNLPWSQDCPGRVM